MLYIVGTFFGMTPCGIVLCCYELFISESKSQVYGILHDVFSKWDMDEIGRCSFTKRERFIYLFILFFLHLFLLHLHCITRFDDDDAICRIKYQVTRINGEGKI